MCTDKSLVVQRFGFLLLLWGNPLSKVGAEGWEGLPDKWAVSAALAPTLFIPVLSKLPLNMKYFLLCREPAVEFAPAEPSVGQVRGNVAPSWAQWSSLVTWAGQSKAGIHEPPSLLGQAGAGAECLHWIFSHLCLCCLMSLFCFCFFQMSFVLF